MIKVRIVPWSFLKGFFQGGPILIKMGLGPQVEEGVPVPSDPGARIVKTPADDILTDFH